MHEELLARVALSCSGRPWTEGSLLPGGPVATAEALLGPGYPQPARRAVESWRQVGGEVVVPAGSGWDQLADLGPASPILLWCRGRPGWGADRLLAVVGSRQATDYGLRVAADLACGARDAGYAVVSGGAVGIDGSAHRAALRGGGGSVVVAAGGAGLVYPPGHAGLFEDCARSGAVVWEFGPGVAPSRRGFLHRNRLIAAMASVVVVVEAAARSGSLNTGRTAADLARLVLAVPGPVTSRLSAGTHQAVCDGWAGLLCGAEDLRRLLATHPQRLTG